MKLTLPSCIVRIERDGKSLFFNPDVPSWVVTDSNGSIILSLCDGTMSKDEIVELFRSKYGDEQSALVDNFLIGCINLRLFEVPRKVDIPIRRTNGDLNIVQFSISSKCNLNCKYCYVTDRVESRHPKMTLLDYQRVIDEICELSETAKFTITGGEPLVNPYCIEIANYIKQKGRYVDLLTNATLVTRTLADKMKNVFDRVTISMDGSTKEIHELFRGENTYDITCKNIDMLIEKGIDVRLSMTVNRLNIHNVGSMAKKYGWRLHFAPLFPAGNANMLEQDISISGQEYYTALKSVDGINPLSYCESSLDNSQKCRICKCAIGDSEFSISETGDVYPCQLLHYPQFYIGNIYENSIKDMYYKSIVVEECRTLTVDNSEDCSKCFLKYVCGGACRARSFHESGDIRKSGKFCEYEKMAYVDGLFELYSHNCLE